MKVSFSGGETLKGNNVGITNSELKFILFLFLFIFYLEKLGLGFSLMLYVTVTNYYMTQ